DLLDERGDPIARFVPGTPLRLRVVVDTTGMPGMCIELRFRDEHGLPFAFYSTGVFDQIPLPSEVGRFEFIITLASYMLAAGQYSVDIETCYTNVHADHIVKSAVDFMVEICAPSTTPFNFQQSMGSGILAMSLSQPIDVKRIPKPADV
ncbi:MAG: hypothetical protein JSR47_24205, partial [Proteobacteria bacterium]|nr:hypothetical protein [Pseudomonadota bacterium]